MDDTLVFSRTHEEQQEHPKEVFERLWKSDLFCSPSKCSLSVRTVDFCGHEVSQNTIRPLQNKLDLIKSWRQPKTAQQVRQFWA